MLYEDNYLAHFGIKGQKWGIRRFQNEDGSLTSEGKKRYSSENWREIYFRAGDLSRKASETARSKGAFSKIKAVGYAIQSDRTYKKARKLENERVAFEKKTAEKILNSSSGFEEAKKKARHPGDGIDSNRVSIEIGSVQARKDIEQMSKLTGEEKIRFQNQFLKDLNDNIRLHEEKDAIFHRPHTSEEVDAIDKKIDPADDARMDERAAWLQNTIEKKSGDWYSSRPVTEGFKDSLEEVNWYRDKAYKRKMELQRKYVPSNDWSQVRLEALHKFYDILKKDPEYLSYQSSQGRAEDKLMGRILKDIGFPDTPENRNYIVPYVFWD